MKDLIYTPQRVIIGSMIGETRFDTPEACKYLSNLNPFHCRIYTVVAPRTIRPNSPYNVGVSIDSNAPVKVNVYLTATLSTRGLSTNEERIVEPGTSLTITLTVSTHDSLKMKVEIQAFAIACRSVI